MTDAAAAGLGEQALNDHFRLFVCALAEVVMPDVPLGIDEVESRPVLVVERCPDPVVAVDRDRVIEAHLLHGPADVVDVFLEGELGRVDADRHQALILVPLGPRPDVGKLAQPVDAGIGAEVDHDDVAAQLGGRQWWRIEPFGRAAERGQLTLDREGGCPGCEEAGEPVHLA